MSSLAARSTSSLKASVPAAFRTKSCMPHGSHITYGFFFLLSRTSSGPLQRGQGKTRPFPTQFARVISVISVLSNLDNKAGFLASSHAEGGGRVFSRFSFRKNQNYLKRLSVKFDYSVLEFSTKMARREKATRHPEKRLDIGPRKGPGRPRKLRPSEVRNRSEHYRSLLREYWGVIGSQLVRAKTREQVVQAFDNKAVGPHVIGEFVPALAPLILKVLQDSKFPKTREARIGFLADSLAARGLLSPRYSRDVCARERAKPLHYLIRQEFYIECTCKYKGPALYGACPRCGTESLHPQLLLRMSLRGSLCK